MKRVRRKQREPVVGIYKITSPSGNVYIGQSWDVYERWEPYDNMRCSTQPAIYNSFKKYGVKNHKFEIICELPPDITQEVLDNYEILYWKQYKDCGFKMLNCKEPGKGGKLSKESIEKMSRSLIGRKPWNTGLKLGPMPQEWKDNISTALKGRPTKNMALLHSAEVREKAVKTRILQNRKITEEHREIVRKSSTGNKYGVKNKGKVRTQENKDKISASLKALKSNKGENHPNSKLKWEDVIEIRALNKRGMGSRKIGKIFNMSKTNILDIINHKIWKTNE